MVGRLKLFCGLAMVLLCAAANAPDLPRIALQPWVQRVHQPVFVAHDGTSRLFIVDQAGKILVMVDGQVQAQPFLDISRHVFDQSECGMLSVAFHPKFAKNGLFYVYYSADDSRINTLHSVIAEFHAESPTATTVDPSTQRILLEIHKPYANHNGGQLQFGPDGYLYLGTGDGGAGGDPQNRAQNPGELLGKMLRIDINHRSEGMAYAIPDDNPFVGRPGYRPEIWTLGMRNPWRFSFDRKTHELYCADVGQDKWEEIDIITRGGNYGWRIMEGLHPYNVPRSLPPNLNLIPPIKEYGHNEGICIIGGYVYRGKAIPALQGWYVYGDYGKGWIAGLKYQNQRIVGDSHLFQTTTQISSFGEDVDGELYMCDYGHDRVYKIVAGH